ncbi:ABC transporter ATP-binding protein [Ferrovibrio sp.]|uniref:ABC transporter ATP-binding protein n=1 Tax=Ferrovibrio sp. TaxID=1917215 RepID=UPI003D2B4CA6
MASITLKKVSKRFAGMTVVDGIDLAIADGEFMVLVGPSGCGKSTTLRMIAGLEATSGGEIWIGNRDVTQLDPKDRNIAMVFQNYALYAHKNVYGNMAFGLQMRGTDKAEIDRRVRDAARLLDITDLLERKPKQLSGGQRQRVALGRALVRDPDAFLLDEPLSNLDAQLRVRMREEIGALHAKTGRSMVYVTHDQVEAMTLGDRIAVMKSGILQQVGAPLELYDRPANLFVAGFIGSPEINRIDAALAVESERFVLRGDGFSLTLPESARSAGLVPGAVVLGIRPESLARSDAAEAVADAFQVEIGLVEQMGAQTLLVCRSGNTSLRALMARDDSVSRGQRIALRWASGSLHLFDPQSGRTLYSAKS